MKNQIQQIAKSFSQIGEAGETIDNLANGLFAPLKSLKVKTLDEANKVFAEAYDLNGYSRTAGRPVAGATTVPAPDAVKLYVTTFRAGFKLGLDVLGYATVGQLRTAIREKRAELAEAQHPEPPAELKGLRLMEEHRLNGALFHDVPTLWQMLPGDKRDQFFKRIQKVYEEFRKIAAA